MKTRMGLVALATAAMLSLSGNAMALTKRTFCVFDIIGANGDTFNIMRDYKTAAVEWGVDVELKPYTDEKIASEDLKAGQCDAAVLTGIRGRQFNSYTGSMDSIGAIPSYDAMRTVIAVIASNSPSVNQHLVSGPYEVGGVAPLGAAFLFLKDKEIDTVEELAGKSIAVLEYDSAQASMASRVGMSPVMSDITNFSTRFNNGSVDICFAPVMGYSALELYKGMSPDGGIVNYPIVQLTAQLIGHTDRFPPAFAAVIREVAADSFSSIQTALEKEAGQIPKHWWIEVDGHEKLQYDSMMRAARMKLRETGYYDATMLKIMKRIRCKLDAQRPECSQETE